MKENTLVIVMVGLPARGKSTIASRLKEDLRRDGIRTRIFNNGDLRRRLKRLDTSSPEFYDPQNREGTGIREKIALTNIRRAERFLRNGGRIAILDATNVSRNRRKTIAALLKDFALLFVECINEDREILEASIERKIALPEFAPMGRAEALESFLRRIAYYETIYAPLSEERNFVRLDSLYNRILEEEISEPLPYYDRLRDLLVSDSVKNLYLVRHGETFFNLEDRIGGDSPLTPRGREQAEALGAFFSNKRIPMIFTSTKKRTIQTAEPIMRRQEHAAIIPLREFDEIDSGDCECMSYGEIRNRMPEVYEARKRDKFNYVYPNGEGYVTMKTRIDRGIKKALYLSGNADHIMIVGHRAVNRMILSHFLYRRQEDVPYIYIPQHKFYHIVATQDRKQFRLRSFAPRKAVEMP
ncbi:MAG: histidine phosphatase family protein [Deltaproteobacteria bacterium]|nr:histidine phosphatase family protein [Deltaproteobacteria bacterium]MBW1948611.1 histidine phosphatase family protein [Deltaproteobacteria bacterium]MBW2007939.1 histidine phosphatase family protein [Deltaproteobacteria bacterium]